MDAIYDIYRCQVPALAKGLELLTLLADSGPLTLDVCATRLKHPKSSVLRMLRTLGAMGLTSMDQGPEKRWSARGRLVPLAGGGREREALRRSTLHDLSQKTGMAAEWYLPADGGLMLSDRAAPAEADLVVRARLGMLRSWAGELDAVNSVGAVFLRSEPLKLGRHWAYDVDGKKRPLGLRKGKAILAAAAETGASIDEHYNSNGVRRMARIVTHDGRPEGVIAIAMHHAPGRDSSIPEMSELLENAAGKLSKNERNFP